nr:formylglycine-generating enzyme family protein [Lyngbya confervoides]
MAQPFFMGKSPITQAQWCRVAQMSKVEREIEPDPSNFKGDNRPVEQVSWTDSVEFCRRLSKETNRPYRLPTEAEWEYACRAGTTTPFHFGESITPDLANYRGTDLEYEGSHINYSGAYGAGPHGEFRAETTEVGSFKVANAFGLYDMHGNVWEWCQDPWHESYDQAPIDGRAWLDKSNHHDRCLRGGSWYYYPGGCRSAFRVKNEPDFRNSFTGLRVVCGVART